MRPRASQRIFLVMNIDLAALPDDVVTLQWMVRTLAAERESLSKAQAEIERLRLIVQKLQRSQFARAAADGGEHHSRKARLPGRTRPLQNDR